MDEEPLRPWHQSNLFWGCATTAIAILVTVIAAMVRDIRWLLVGAWPFAIVAIWEFSRTLKLQETGRWTAIGGILASMSLYGLYDALAPNPLSAPTLTTPIGGAPPAIASPPPVIDRTDAPKESGVKGVMPSTTKDILIPDAGKAEQPHVPFGETGSQNPQVIYPPPASVKLKGRIFALLDNINTLTEPYNTKTSHDADAENAPYMGTWVAVSSTISDNRNDYRTGHT